MPLTQTDFQRRFSGGATNTDPNASLGGAMSATAFTSAVAANLFDNVAGVESSAGDIEYRCFYIVNLHPTLTYKGAVVFIAVLTLLADTEFDIGLDPAPVGSDSGTIITTEGEAPVGVTFTRPITKATGLVIGDIPAASRKAVWVRRTVNAATAAGSDTGTIRFSGDTDP